MDRCLRTKYACLVSRDVVVFVWGREIVQRLKERGKIGTYNHKGSFAYVPFDSPN